MARQPSETLERKTAVLNPKRSIYIITEGITEKNYMDHIKNNFKFSDKILDVEIIDKGLLNRDVSDRRNLVHYFDGWRNLRSNRKCKIEHYISIVLENYYNCYNKNPEIEPKLMELYKELCNDIRISCHQDVDGDGRVSESSTLFKDIYSRCYKKFPDTDTAPESMEKPSKLEPPKQRFLSEDQFYIMFDRDFDREYRDKKEYDETIAFIEKKKYIPLVTTPQFELWLLMHFQDASFAGIKYNTNSASIECRLSQKDAREGDNEGSNKKYIDNKRFESTYLHNIPVAISTSLDKTRFVTDVMDLEHNIGTNLGLFLRDILGLETFDIRDTS